MFQNMDSKMISVSKKVKHKGDKALQKVKQGSAKSKVSNRATKPDDDSGKIAKRVRERGSDKTKSKTPGIVTAKKRATGAQEGKKKRTKRYTEVEKLESSDLVDKDSHGGDVDFVADDVPVKEEPQKKKKRKSKRSKREQIEEEENTARGPAVIYVGHIPHGFYEDQMKEYFSQYGKVERVKLSRSKKTGRSKGYGFIEFESDSVASIAAQSMNGYLMFGQALDVHVVEPGKVHPELFKGTSRVFRTVPWRVIDRRRRNRVRSEADLQRIQKKLTTKERKRREQLTSLGIDYDFPGYEAEAKKAEKKK